MCVRVCPAGVWGVDIHSLCHRTFIERLLHICPVLSTGANEKWCLGRGKTRGGGGPVGRGVAGRRPGWCWEVWLQGECEHPRHTAGWRLPGATRQPCRKRWAVCILRLRKPRPERSESPPPGSLRQQVVEVGPSPGHLTAEHMLSPVFPPFPCPRAWGSTAQCSCSGTPWGPQPVRRPDSAAS